MTSNAIYPYAQRDLLDLPEYYMYSVYHGNTFLKEYLEQRAEYVAAFEKKYVAALKEMNPSDVLWLQDWKDIIERSGSLLSKDIQLGHTRLFSLFDEKEILSARQSVVELDSAANIYTEPVLKTLLQTAAEQEQSSRDIYLLWLNRFLKRFEVSKKLYSIYLPSMKAASDDYSSQLNYALLSLALLYEYEWTGNLKMLNAVLKLNDLLCSKSKETTASETLLTTILAIHKERFMVQQIMTAKGVTL